jgi:hypothetical protein
LGTGTNYVESFVVGGLFDLAFDASFLRGKLFSIMTNFSQISRADSGTVDF